MKITAIIACIASLFGCKPGQPQILDGPGMVYIDKDYRTEYANQLDFDSYDGYPLFAVAYLGTGEEAETAASVFIDKLFAGLSEESIAKIRHFDFGGQNIYLVIPRYENCIDIKNTITDELHTENYGTPFTVKCDTGVEICDYSHGGHTYSLAVDSNGVLVAADDIWDITSY